jgi:hypothetical protein
MRITVRGWGRDQGKKVIMNAALGSAERQTSGGSFSRNTTYLFIDYPGSRRLTKARVATHTEVRLGGDYLLQVELSRDEIAQLFYETHDADIVRMFQSFVAGEQSLEAQERIRRYQLIREGHQSSAEEDKAE